MTNTIQELFDDENLSDDTLSDFIVEAKAFRHEETMPKEFTCEGEDEAPALIWRGYPQSTRSFTLLVEDPDAPDPAGPTHTHVHCLIYNIPPDCHELPAGFTPLPEGAAFGRNGWDRTDYGGPCPPKGTHRYFFKVFALDDPLDLAPGASKEEVERAMGGKVLGVAYLIGLYRKQAAA